MKGLQALLAAALWGLSYAISARLVHTYPPAVLLMLNTLASLPVLILLSLTPSNRQGLHALAAGKDGWLVLAEMAIGLCASLSIFYALKTNPVESAIIETSYPLFIILFSYILFGTIADLSWKTLIGGLLIATGVFTITTR